MDDFFRLIDNRSKFHCHVTCNKSVNAYQQTRIKDETQNVVEKKLYFLILCIFSLYLNINQNCPCMVFMMILLTYFTLQISKFNLTLSMYQQNI